MKHLLTGLVAICTSLCVYTQTNQNQEFRTEANGLMYSEADMKKLRYIVDSLNLRFKKCDLSKTFNSFPQATIYEARFKSETDPLTAIKKDIDQGIDFHELLRRYGTVLSETDTTLCILTGDDKDGPSYLTGSPSTGYRSARFYGKRLSKGKITYELSPKDKYSSHHLLRVTYCPSEFVQQPLPLQYAAYIQYVDCMVDTSATVFLSTAKRGDFYEIEETIKPLSKKEQLQRLRNTIVVGGCSQDQSPREHARNIAILAAETHSWDIFLRAHLDIMNDRFERRSDGNYAWNLRQTYLKELEELNLNIVDLMIGLSLRAYNTAANHYYGSIWRVGWALTESRDRKGFEAKAIEMMKDPALDEFNRGLLFLLYRSYADRLTDEQERRTVMHNMKNNVQSFPASLREAIRSWEEPKD